MRKFKLLLTATFAMLLLTQLSAQDKPKSPKMEVSGKVGGANVKIVYNAPSARGRAIMGSLVPYGEVWRTGANAATTIEFDKAVKIEGKDLAAGKYALFTIPNENEWVVIFSKKPDQSGAFEYKQEEDALRVNVKPTKTDKLVETFTITPEKDQVTLKWENTAVAFKVK
jgi:hypothetical protein